MTNSYTISLRRTVNVPVNVAFDSWTKAELAKQWLCPQGLTVPEAIIEPRVGGTYRIVMLDPKGQRPTTNGVIKEYEQNKKLVFTWQWEDDKDFDGQTIVSLNFIPVGENKTELIMSHEEFKTEKSKNSHEQGWGSVFNHLEQTLGK